MGVKGKNDREGLAAFLLRLRSAGITDKGLLNAFEAVPRRNFVPIIHVNDAYARGQMPIECGQSMTAVTMVAKILALLDVRKDHKVLELGTGTGYQTAVLAHLSGKVASVERFRTLHDKARQRLSQLQINNARLILGDGSKGTRELDIHDRIVANCAFKEPPREFIDNIAANGIMIAPVGEPGEPQVMQRFIKIGSRLQVEDLFEVRTQPFLPGVSKAI